MDHSSGAAQPDPRRYEKIEKEEKELYLDKYLNVAFGLDQISGAFQEEVPSYAMSPAIGPIGGYATGRLNALESEFHDGKYVAPVEEAVRHRELHPDTVDKQLGFLSVDICGATALRKADNDQFDRAYDILLRELGTLVGLFNGAILKTTGDGYIAYIDHPSFTNLCDGIIDLGLCTLKLLHESVNPALLKHNLPEIDIRIGADYGEARVKKYYIAATGFSSTEIASDALNRAVKIETACERNEFRIGRCLYELIHVGWLERAEEVGFDGHSVGLEGYQTYKMR
ncbi:hypothetical protein RB2083_2536 [Rhodobacteraceae bacterium HTCC2083]|nr:hypothetical protein RB2083_2536 [Rhodobacteraceae bacterium HTCC2083]